MAADTPYKRILLKLSGEVLMGKNEYGVDVETARRIAVEIGQVADLGIEIGLVIGGGNIFRGLSGAAQGMNRTSADYMGMLATVMNALAMQSVLHAQGRNARVLSAIPMPTVCEPYTCPRAIGHLDKKRIVIFAAGTGNPFFTTDTAAALRAAEIGSDVLFKGTSVDGVYSADPKTTADAQRYDRLNYQDLLVKNLKVMDTAAITLARDNAIPVIVFSIRTPGSLLNAVRGQGRFTVISDENHQTD